MASDLSVLKPTFEHLASGFGLGYAMPRISWRFESCNNVSQGWIQQQYEIQILFGGCDTPESYLIKSQQSVLVPWPARALLSREQVCVRVRAWGTDKAHADARQTPWSEWASAEVGLLSSEDWYAQPVQASTPTTLNKPQRCVLFRRRFRLPENQGRILHARLYATAHGVYEAQLNGQYVGDHCMDPGWTSYKHHLHYQIFNVGRHLQIGDNVLGVHLGEGWFAGRLGFLGGKSNHYGHQLTILLQLEVVFSDGFRWQLGSDDTFKCFPSPVLQSEIYNGEILDMRHSIKNWSSPELHDHTWMKTTIGCMPKGVLRAPNRPPVRVVEEIKPVEILRSPSGRLIVDFGQNVVGKVCIKNISGSEGAKIVLRHAEVLEHGELCIRPLRSAESRDILILSGETIQEWTPRFTFHGFRYVQIDGLPSECCQSLTALVMHSDMKRTGWFECSDPLVSKLHENTVWSMRGNFLSIPTDCPQRDERLGWTGDIQIFCRSAAFLYDCVGLLRDWLDDLAAEQEWEGGIPPFVVPNVIGHLWPQIPQAVWDDAVVLVPWDLYRSSGDVEILRRQYPSMRTWIDHGVLRGKDKLWDSELWQLGDWLDPNAPADNPGESRTNGVLVADAYLVRVTTTLSEICRLLGDVEAYKQYHNEAEHLRAAFQNKYITPWGLLASDTQTALSLAIVFGLHEDAIQVHRAAQRLVQLVKMAEFRVSTGFAGTPIITHALSMTGNVQTAYSMLLEKRCPSWLYPVCMGATTVWERWDSMLPSGDINPGEMTSFNHYALGSIVNWLHEVVGGISPSEAGWAQFSIQPRPGGTIRSAKVAYESRYGRIESSWAIKRTGDHEVLELNVLIPPNTKAQVILPTGSYGTTTESTSNFELGSGLYNFERRYEAGNWPVAPIIPFPKRISEMA